MDDDNESYESIEKRDAPITEIVRTTDIRERLFNPKNQRSHCDSTLMEHSDPDSVTKEIVELKDLYEKEAANDWKNLTRMMEMMVRLIALVET